jgi:glycosyltransferase involved in cell wall biosynthesis
MTKPRVSSIIIVYNGEAFLDEAIRSVIAQTFQDWELIVVDDGSTDSSLAIANGYAAADPVRIRAIRHPDGRNHGMGATRNLGISQARGDYIGFLDADDVWVPEKLEEQVSILDREVTAGLIYGRTLVWDSWSDGNHTTDFYYDLGVTPDRLYQPPVLFDVLLTNKYQTPTTCNALMRAGLVAAVGGFDAVFRGMFEDQTFFAKALICAPAYVSSRSWARYRQHAQSCSSLSNASRGDEAARLAYLRWLRRYLAGRKIGTQSRLLLWRELIAALWQTLRRRAAGLKRLRIAI